NQATQQYLDNRGGNAQGSTTEARPARPHRRRHGDVQPARQGSRTPGRDGGHRYSRPRRGDVPEVPFAVVQERQRSNGRSSWSGTVPALGVGVAVIPKNEMMAMLLDACPSYAPAWEAFLTEWREEADNLPLYLALAQLARHLASMLARCETETFPQVFAVI